MLSFTHDFLNQALTDATDSYAECQQDIQETVASPSVESDIDTTRAEVAMSQIDALSDKLATTLRGDYSEQRVKAYQETRLFKHVRMVDRGCTHPDTLHTFFVTICCILGEGVMAGAMFAFEGKTGLVGGFAYGMCFATVNVLSGMAIGFFTLRYWLDYYNRPGTYRIRRALACAFFFISISFLSVLIFSAARVRVTGSHSDIFDFETFSFFGTFNDGLTLVIFALGLLGSVVAIYKGYKGLSDPIPGYSESETYPKRIVDLPVQAMVESTIESLDAMYDSAVDDIESVIDETEAQQETQHQKATALQKKLIAHNTLIEQLTLKIKHQRDAEGFIEQSNETLSLDISNLHIPIAETLAPLTKRSRASPRYNTVLNRLQTAYENGIHEIQTAHAAFLNSTTLLETGENNAS